MVVNILVIIDVLAILIFSESFPYAIKLPVNVIPPIARVSITNAAWNKLSGPLLNSDQAIKKVAKPPNPLNSATISGIDVILTLSAIKEPMMAPKNMPLNKTSGFIIPMHVIPTAINIATAERKLPLTAVDSLPSIFIPVIKRTEEIIYVIFFRVGMSIKKSMIISS